MKICIVRHLILDPGRLHEKLKRGQERVSTLQYLGIEKYFLQLELPQSAALQSVALLASRKDSDLADMAFMYGRNIGKHSRSPDQCSSFGENLFYLRSRSFFSLVWLLTSLRLTA